LENLKPEINPFLEGFCAGLKPDPILKVSEWADEYRILSQRASAEPGKWHTNRTPYLKEVMDTLSAFDPTEEICFMAGAQVGKALAIDTPIPTPCGWKFMKDLRAGDQVFDENGIICNVTNATNVMLNREVFAITFSDKTVIIADSDHKWEVWDENHSRTAHKKIATTKEMSLTFNNENGNRYEIKMPWVINKECDAFLFHKKNPRIVLTDVESHSVCEKIQIVDIKSTSSVPVKCITVDSKSHLYLAGESMIPTHNSETGNNWIGYIIDHAPGPMMCVQPTVELAKRYSKQRIDSLIEETPRLKDKVKAARERDSGNTVLSKEFIGGLLIITGANSAAGLRSLPARYLFLDEIDAYPSDASGEGDPLDLAKARTRTYAKRKIFMTSTPTINGRSKIEKIYAESDQRKYYVPCPHCNHMQTIEWINIKWENDKADTVYLVCAENGCIIEESSKTQMLENGKWIKQNLDSNKAGFFLTSLYSPLGWYSWREAVRDWLAAQKDQDKLKTFVNTVLAETWKEKGDAPEWRLLYERREEYQRNTIPDSVDFLTAGVDVQKDRLEMQIIGWNTNRESWSIDYRVIPGDTSDLSESGPWGKLKPMIADSWKTKRGIMTISMTGIDSGYQTQVVYNFCRQYPLNKVAATKGFDNIQTVVGQPKSTDVNQAGKRLRRGLKVWPIGSSHIKSDFYGKLKLHKPTENEMSRGYPAGFCHFPEYEEEYFKQLTAEQIQVRFHKGYRKYDWVKTYERNEALDTWVIARAMASILGLERMENRKALHIEVAESTDKIENKVINTENMMKSLINNGNINIVRKKGSFF